MSKTMDLTSRSSPTQIFSIYEIWGVNQADNYFKFNALHDDTVTTFASLEVAKAERDQIEEWYTDRQYNRLWKKLIIVRLEITGTILYGE